MSYQLAFGEKPTYLHVVVTGENSRDTVERYTQELVRACAARSCTRVLIEERLVGARLGVALGARAETFMGLAGLGDLVLTCTDDQSRNRRFGLLLAAGRSPEAALEEIGQAVEGYAAARAIEAVAARAAVEMPLCAMVYRVLYEKLPAKDAVRALMGRPIKSEAE